MKRSDRKAMEILKRGCLTRQKLRFITITGVSDFRKQWRQLKSWLQTKMDLFEYFGVRTGEGTGVVHFVYEGKSVRWQELRDAWKEITGKSWIVHISAIKNMQAIIHELTRQSRKQRYFHSKHWLPPLSTQIKFG